MSDDENVRVISKPKRVRLNARGFIFEIPLASFLAYPKSTRLGKLSNFREMNTDEIYELCDDFNAESREFYFDRNPSVLGMVLDYYVTGELHNSNTVMCQVYVEKELKYWIVNSADMKRCCKVEYEKNYESRDEEINLEQKTLKEITMNGEDSFDNLWQAELRQKLWTLLEYPNSSNGARVGLFSFCPPKIKFIHYLFNLR